MGAHSGGVGRGLSGHEEREMNTKETTLASTMVKELGGRVQFLEAKLQEEELSRDTHWEVDKLRLENAALKRALDEAWGQVDEYLGQVRSNLKDRILPEYLRIQYHSDGGCTVSDRNGFKVCYSR
jgi:hypothetical protein